MGNIKSNYFTRFLLVLLLLNVAFMGQSRNVDYRGTEILFDRPEGEVRSFKADFSYLYAPSYGLYDKNGIKSVSMVTTPEGTVYINGIKSNAWVECQLDGGNILIPNGAICGFDYFDAFNFEDWSPLISLELARFMTEDNKIETDESLTHLIFIPNESGGYDMNMPESTGFIYGRQEMVYEMTLVPTKTEIIEPPKGYEEEDYQINFTPFAQTIFPSVFDGDDRASFRLKVVRTADSFYIKGLYLSDDSMWIKGRISGNKISFPNGEPIGITSVGTKIYMNAVKFNDDYDDNPYGHPHYGGKVEAVKLPFSFDYDSETGTLGNPSGIFELSFTPNESWSVSFSSEDKDMALANGSNFFNKPEIIKLPENYEYKPIPPQLVKYSNGTSYTFRVSYLDANGYMMDPYNMYLKFYRDEEPLSLNYFSIETWQYETGEMVPYGPQYMYTTQGLDGIGPNLVNNQRCSFIWYKAGSPVDISKIELIYEENGETWDSSAVGTVMHETLSPNENTPVYDLMGRKVSQDNLTRGIYIRNGKKFVVN